LCRWCWFGAYELLNILQCEPGFGRSSHGLILLGSGIVFLAGLLLVACIAAAILSPASLAIQLIIISLAVVAAIVALTLGAEIAHSGREKGLTKTARQFFDALNQANDDEKSPETKLTR
jgi:membrane protein implicated in regulation of membrane protease activity